MSKAGTFFDLAPPGLVAEARYVMAEAMEIRALKRRFLAEPTNSALGQSIAAAEPMFATHLERLLGREDFRKLPTDFRDYVESECLV